jgi:hypothetical protein
MEELPFLYTGEVNTSVTMEELLRKGVFCWGRPEAIQYNDDFRKLRGELRKSLESAVEDD